MSDPIIATVLEIAISTIPCASLSATAATPYEALVDLRPSSACIPAQPVVRMSLGQVPPGDLPIFKTADMLALMQDRYRVVLATHAGGRRTIVRARV